MRKQQSERNPEVSEESRPEVYHRFNEFAQEERRRAKLCTTSRLPCSSPSRSPQAGIRIDARTAQSAPGRGSANISSDAAQFPKRDKPFFNIKYPDSQRLFAKTSGAAPSSNPGQVRLNRPREPERGHIPNSVLEGFTTSADEVCSPIGSIDREGFRELMRKKLITKISKNPF